MSLERRDYSWYLSCSVIADLIKHIQIRFQITVGGVAGPEVDKFRDLIPIKMAQPPWNYNKTLESGQKVLLEIVNSYTHITAAKGNKILGLIRRNIVYKEKELIMPLYKT